VPGLHLSGNRVYRELGADQRQSIRASHPRGRADLIPWFHVAIRCLIAGLIVLANRLVAAAEGQAVELMGKCIEVRIQLSGNGVYRAETALFLQWIPNSE